MCVQPYQTFWFCLRDQYHTGLKVACIIKRGKMFLQIPRTILQSKAALSNRDDRTRPYFKAPSDMLVLFS